MLIKFRIFGPWQDDEQALYPVYPFCYDLDPALLDDLQLRLDRAEEEFRVANLDGRIQELKDARISQVRHLNWWQK